MNPAEINPNTLVPFYHPDYEQPSSDDVRALLKHRQWTGRQGRRTGGRGWPHPASLDGCGA